MTEAVHLKSGNVYRIISENHKVQIGDVWHDAVLYEAVDRNHHGTTFTRTLLDFNMKFRRITKQPGEDKMDSRVQYLLDVAIQQGNCLRAKQYISTHHMRADDPSYQAYLQEHLKREQVRLFGDYLVRNNLRMQHYKEHHRLEEVIQSEVFIFGRDELILFLTKVVQSVHFVEPNYARFSNGNDLGLFESQGVRGDTPFREEDCTSRFGIGKT